MHSAGSWCTSRQGHIDEAALRAQLEVNLVAPLRLGEQALEVLEPGGGMVFIASTLAARPSSPAPSTARRRRGLLQAMQVLALSGAAQAVRANAVLPGVVDTDMVRELRDYAGRAPPSEPSARLAWSAQLGACERCIRLAASGSLGRWPRP